MRPIHVHENTREFLMAGDGHDRIWNDLWRLKHNSVQKGAQVSFRHGSACPSQGCHRCTDPDCSFAAFVRQYLDHPRCD